MPFLMARFTAGWRAALVTPRHEEMGPCAHARWERARLAPACRLAVAASTFLVLFLSSAPPGFPQAPPWVEHNNRGRAYLREGQIDAAIAEFGEALRLKPDRAATYIDLSLAYHRKGQYDAAIAVLQRALRLEPDNPAVHYGLGRVYTEKKQYDAAITSLQEANRLRPNDAPTFLGLGYAYYDKGSYDAAIGWLQEANRLRPNYVPTLYGLGSAYYRKGSYDAAIGWFKEAVRIQPDYPEVRRDLGLAYARMQNRPAALAEYEWLKGRDAKMAEGLLLAIQRGAAAAPASAAGGREGRAQVELREVKVEPIQVVPGLSVNVVLEYTVDGLGPGEDHPVQEERRVQLLGKVLGQFTEVFRRGPGTYRSTRPIHIPLTAGPGEYTIVGSVKAFGGFLGVQIRDVAPEATTASGAQDMKGALVVQVGPGSPAARGGLREGDVVITFDGRPVETSAHLRRLVSEVAPGTTVAVHVLREQGELMLGATTGEPPSEPSSPRAASKSATLLITPR
jgi:tetratricopeptide (TPR) repeat protein